MEEVKTIFGMDVKTIPDDITRGSLDDIAAYLKIYHAQINPMNNEMSRFQRYLIGADYTYPKKSIKEEKEEIIWF